MKISRIYEKYNIMPQLQLHMLRVAGVALTICDNFEGDSDKDSIITACLLHDIGNIVKFKLDLFPENLEPQGLEYWEKVKSDFIEKWGSDDHVVTKKICEELGIDKKIVDIIDLLGFANTPVIYRSKNIVAKICKYSDLRVTPTGVDSLRNRLEEAKKRYLKKGTYTEKQFNEFVPMWEEIEKQIFARCKIKPDEINDEKVSLVIEGLRGIDVVVA